MISLTPEHAVAILNLPDRGPEGRTALFKSLQPEEREDALLAIILALREIPETDRADVIAGIKPLTERQRATFERLPERLAA